MRVPNNTVVVGDVVVRVTFGAPTKAAVLLRLLHRRLVVGWLVVPVLATPTTSNVKQQSNTNVVVGQDDDSMMDGWMVVFRFGLVVRIFLVFNLLFLPSNEFVKLY